MTSVRKPNQITHHIHQINNMIFIKNMKIIVGNMIQQIRLNMIGRKKVM